MAERDTRLEPNRVFIMPAAMDMTVTDNRFYLRERSKPYGWPTTISIFLCSLAEVIGQRTVAVIVSGMDGEGSSALKAIKAAGGITFAQSDAAHASMPRNAVETGCVDFMLPSAEIAKALANLPSIEAVLTERSL
jgi:chemotaxis response regulator CheB